MSARNPDFNEDHTPLAYLITFRCYGTWLHGDERGSVDRYHNRYGTLFIPPNERWRLHNEQLLKYPPVELDAERCAAVDAAVRETCEKRNWLLRAINVRTNHAHIVVTAGCKPEAVLSAFKANATRKMREEKRWRRRPGRYRSLYRTGVQHSETTRSQTLPVSYCAVISARNRSIRPTCQNAERGAFPPLASLW